MYAYDDLMLMTDEELDEVAAQAADRGDRETVDRVDNVLDSRLADAEEAYEAENERQQALHDEMIDDMLANDGRWG